MNQESLFHEDIYDALRSCIQALGGAKKVGAKMWPELAADKAGNRLNDSLNTQRREHLNPEQVLFILSESRKINCHLGMHYLADRCDYKRPEAIEPEDEMAKLQREYIQMVRQMQKIAGQLQHVSEMSAAK